MAEITAIPLAAVHTAIFKIAAAEPAVGKIAVRKARIEKRAAAEVAACEAAGCKRGSLEICFKGPGGVLTCLNLLCMSENSRYLTDCMI